MKCRVCGKRLRLDKEYRYEVVTVPTVIGVLSGEHTTVFEAFDCPKCGCQNIVNVKEVGCQNIVDVKEVSTNVANEKCEE